MGNKLPENPLEYVGETDYVLNPEFDSVWIEVDAVSVYIRRGGDGLVIVELCETGNEAESTLDTCQAAGGAGS